MSDHSQNKDRAVPAKETEHEAGNDPAANPETERVRAEHERRRRDEPAAAALEADAEAGSAVSPSGAALRSGVPDPGAPADPVPAAEAAHRRDEIAENERRAGPGDAGASDRPTPLPQDKVERDNRSRVKPMIWIAVALLVLLIVIALF
ncbi:hypothetical protein [Citreimonas salinaria]|uniref:Uncharacterized protein n=1 Tax=Citreimonas salinaria TaxID=321339 RepID=A0A1H3J7C0_9RHOB|nr:hypothetical protein [Citreimonas salinaria]SDY35084.1 hypothetical protein SAMN05444340_10662 [Citreimonas salinaria]